jgi:hypothetical protein
LRSFKLKIGAATVLYCIATYLATVLYCIATYLEVQEKDTHLACFT